jgi:hypothetical protein
MLVRKGSLILRDAAPLQHEAQLLKFLVALDCSPTISRHLRSASLNSASMRATSTMILGLEAAPIQT